MPECERLECAAILARIAGTAYSKVSEVAENTTRRDYEGEREVRLRFLGAGRVARSPTRARRGEAGQRDRRCSGGGHTGALHSHHSKPVAPSARGSDSRASPRPPSAGSHSRAEARTAARLPRRLQTDACRGARSRSPVCPPPPHRPHRPRTYRAPTAPSAPARPEPALPAPALPEPARPAPALPEPAFPSGQFEGSRRSSTASSILVLNVAMSDFVASGSLEMAMRMSAMPWFHASATCR